MKRRAVGIVLAVNLAALSVFTAGCGTDEKAGTGAGEAKTEDSKEEGEEVLEVYTVRPVGRTIENSTEFMGTLEAEDETDVYVKIASVVDNVYFEEGDYVNAGDILFTMEADSQKLSLKNAEASYQSAKANTDLQLAALDVERSNNLNSLQSAQENLSGIQDSYAYYETMGGYYGEDINDYNRFIDDAKDDEHDSRKDLKDARKDLENAEASYDEIKVAVSNLEDLKNDYNTASDEEKEVLKNSFNVAYQGLTGATVDDPNSADLSRILSDAASRVSNYKSQVSGYESKSDGYESAQDNYELQARNVRKQAASNEYNKNNLKYSQAQGERRTALIMQDIANFETHKVPDTQQGAKATVDQAQVAVDTAKLQLGYTKVSAPVSGVIRKKDVELHELTRANSVAYVIANEDTVVAKFYVTENVWKNLETGVPVVVERDGKEYNGSVTELSSTVDASGLFEVKAVVDAAPGELNTGTAVKISVVTESQQNVISIPVDCVYYEAAQAYVYAVEDGVVKRIDVTAGIFDDKYINITDGITEDTVIVSTWSADLRDGLSVKVIKDETEEAEAASENEISDSENEIAVSENEVLDSENETAVSENEVSGSENEAVVSENEATVSQN